MILVANFTTSPGQVNYDALAAGIFFTITIQNILEIAAIAIAAVIMSLRHTIVIVVVTAAAAIAAAAATAANPVFKVSNQRQLR